MARALDPECPRFLGTVRLPGGKYQGRTLIEVASTIDGLLYLHHIISGKQSPSFVHPLLERLLESFLEQPRQQQALFRAKGRR